MSQRLDEGNCSYPDTLRYRDRLGGYLEPYEIRIEKSADVYPVTQCIGVIVFCSNEPPET
jgi:hypothetical protein